MTTLSDVTRFLDALDNGGDVNAAIQAMRDQVPEWYIDAGPDMSVPDVDEDAWRQEIARRLYGLVAIETVCPTYHDAPRLIMRLIVSLPAPLCHRCDTPIATQPDATLCTECAQLTDRPETHCTDCNRTIPEGRRRFHTILDHQPLCEWCYIHRSD